MIRLLTELSIKNFAIIDDISMTFNEGLTVLTGETGAGKSIIIDALTLLAGGRGSVDYVRHGTDKAEIEGLFTIGEQQEHIIYDVSDNFGIEIDDGMVVLHRTMTKGGKSICRVNGKLVTLAILREFGQTLIDIHSQHETQTLMNNETHIRLLDLFDERIIQAKEDYTALFNKYREKVAIYNELSEDDQASAHRLDLLQFQLKELEEANLSPDEDDTLEKERDYLLNFEKIHKAVQGAYDALYGDQRGIDWLNQAQLSLQENKSYDPFIAEKAEQLTDHFFQVEELSYDLRDFKDSLHYDVNRLNDIEARLHLIQQLKRKYGATVNDMLEYMAHIEDEINQLQNKDFHLERVMNEINGIVKDAWLEAEQMHFLRHEAAAALEKQIHSELKDLYLEHTTFSIDFQADVSANVSIDKKRELLNKDGFDTIKFMISTNPGEPLKELQKIVSGGELSRIMLVIKKIFAKQQGITSVIFDEVDTGVSGRVAQGMAEKIYQIATAAQVLCISHLPQVAAMADTHERIVKREHDGRTTTEIEHLSEKEVIEEISRMMTGATLTDSALQHGENLLSAARNFKESVK